MRRLLVLGLFLAGCPRPPPPVLVAPEVPPPPPIRVPPGCTDDLSGKYVHAGSASYVYRAEDDGGVLTLNLEKLGQDGGGVEIVLARTPKGFVGQATGVGFTSTGHGCPVAFPTEVSECGDGGVTLRSAATASINEECQSPQTGPPPAMLVQRLIRLDAGEGDAGSAPDAGAAPDAGQWGDAG